jgi:hypothetical protein
MFPLLGIDLDRWNRLVPADFSRGRHDFCGAADKTDARCEHVSAASQDGRVWWSTVSPSAEVPPTWPKFRSYGRFWHERRHEHPEVRLSLTATLPQNGGVVPVGGKMEQLLARKLRTPTSSS